MIVTFIAQCQKKSLDTTRQVLDAYANRIGERTWQTVITQEGLNAVRARLAKTARKTTAVACHRIRGTHLTELVWVVGNRRQFDAFGNVPVNRTQRDLNHEDWENDWRFLPLVQVLAALAALFHDFGKSWDHFQTLLANPEKRDPIRHEWVSLLLFRAFVDGRTDDAWLTELLALNQANAKARHALVKKLLTRATPPPASADTPFADGFANAPLALWVAWLIVTHHKLPRFYWDAAQGETHDFTNGRKPVSRQAMLDSIERDMGYIKTKDALKWKFSHGLPLLTDVWCKDAARWARKAQDVTHLIAEGVAVERLLLTLARLALMVGDHFFSSQEKNTRWRGDCALYANTAKGKDGERPLKQRLDEHLLGVTQAALNVAHLLPAFETALPKAHDVKALRKPAKGAFAWQNKAVQKLYEWRKAHDVAKQGFFAVNMASTGCGKTFANAKIMGALQNDGSLRYTLALGLRTLTLQTGDEYRNKLKLDATELAVLIGSAAVRYLHGQREDNDLPTDWEEEEASTGSASATALSADLEVVYESHVPDDRLSTVLRDQKSKQLLYAPVLVATIDHLMPATESTRGGRHILPTLRLLSADVVIDEVDDFDHNDLPAIARLVHLVGMLGRKMMISSATIPPAVAVGLFEAYQAGWQIFATARQRSSSVTAFWVDEFGAEWQLITKNTPFPMLHQTFVEKRSKALARETQVKRRAEIVPVQRQGLAVADLSTHWFATVRDAVVRLHHRHAWQDASTGKQVSIGVVRVAHVDACIELTRYLLGCVLPDGVDMRVMAYHSRQVLLLRSQQERYLDQVLNRKAPRQAGDNAVIRQHLQRCQTPQVIFVLVATPVEEVGRDHDLDWAVIEPSSMRSMIQMAGRVQRHRTVSQLTGANVALLGFNLKGLIGQQPYVFCRPGYESRRYPLDSHDLRELVDASALAQRVDATPRIQCPTVLQPRTRLADLEHQVLNDVLIAPNFVPETVQGWLHSAYYFTSLAQQCKPFRASQRETLFKLHLEADETLSLRQPQEKGVQGKQAFHVAITELEPALRPRLWLTWHYVTLIDEQQRRLGYSTRRTCEFLGEVNLPDADGAQHFVFVPELGFARRKN